MVRLIQLRLLVYSLIFLVCCACAPKEHDYEGITVFRYNQQNPITSLDPAFAKSQNNMWAVNHLFNGLVALDDSLHVVPSIAKSWEISENGKDYRFTLRRDIYFHNDPCFSNSLGRIVDASDVVFSFERILSEEINSPGSWIFSDKVDTVKPFEAINDSTFVLHLSRPFTPTLGILTMQYCSVLPIEIYAFYDNDVRNHPVGTGPYKLKRWEEGQALFLEKNEHYFEKDMPKVDIIKTNFIPDRQIAMLELKNGKIDFISGLESSFINDVLDKEGNLKASQSSLLQLVKTPYLNTEYLGINMEMASQDSPLGNKLIRQALNYAIDKEEMLLTLRNSVGTAAQSGFYPKGLPSFDEKITPGYTYNSEMAKKLIDSAGYASPSDVPTIPLFTNTEYLDLCTFIAKQWSLIGLDVKIEVMETAVLREGMRSASISFFRASWIADYPDEESFLTMFYSKNPAPPNYTRFNNPQFDILYEEATQETINQKRYDLYRAMNEIIIEEAPVVFLFYDESAVFLRKEVGDYTNNALNMLEVKRISINE